MLSNGSAGVFFNDSTKIIGDPLGEQFQYMSRPSPSQDEEMVTHPISQYPSEFQKKVTLLQHFRKHLSIDDPIEQITCPLTFIKK